MKSFCQTRSRLVTALPSDNLILNDSTVKFSKVFQTELYFRYEISFYFYLKINAYHFSETKTQVKGWEIIFSYPGKTSRQSSNVAWFFLSIGLVQTVRPKKKIKKERSHLICLFCFTYLCRPHCPRPQVHEQRKGPCMKLSLQVGPNDCRGPWEQAVGSPESTSENLPLLNP